MPTVSSTFATAGVLPVSARLQRLGLGTLRYGLILMLVAGGVVKWTAAEAHAIHPWLEHSPLLSWLYRVTTLQGASIVIGVVELGTAVLIGARPWAPKLGVVGGAAAAVTFLITLSFLITTPHQKTEVQGFLFKDVFLLATAIWICGEAMEDAT